MAGNYEDILKIPVDTSEMDKATTTLADMDKKIQEASKRSTQGFIEFNKSVDKNNNSLKETNVIIDKMFNKIKLSKLSGGFAGFGKTLGEAGEGAASLLGLGGLLSAGVVGAITYGLKKAMDGSIGMISTTMGAARMGINGTQSMGLSAIEGEMGLSSGSLTQTIYNLNNSLKDVTKGGALSVLGAGALNADKLKKEGNINAFFDIYKAVSNNRMAKDPAMRSLMLRSGAELGINEQIMLDMIQNPEYLQQYKSIYYKKTKDLENVNTGDITKAGRSAQHIAHVIGDAGLTALSSGISKTKDIRNNAVRGAEEREALEKSIFHIEVGITPDAKNILTVSKKVNSTISKQTPGGR